MTERNDTLSLVADVGGTNTRVALAEGAHLLPDSVRRFRNAEADSLVAVLAEYVSLENVECTAAAVAIAGPVENGRGTLTNLDWSIDESILARVTMANRVAVLNDLQAQAFAVSNLKAEKLRPVMVGDQSPSEGTRLVIGFGTGLNAALALPTPAGQVVPPAECGHVTLPVRTRDELGLSEYLEKKHGFASAEDALAGRGVENIYAWHAEGAGQTNLLKGAEIIEAAQSGSDDLAVATVQTYVTLMGRFVGDLALIHLPFGGIYLIGGVSRAMMPFMQAYGFSVSFQDKGRFSDFMRRFSVSVVEDDFAALSGLATHLAEGEK